MLTEKYGAEEYARILAQSRSNARGADSPSYFAEMGFDDILQLDRTELRGHLESACGLIASMLGAPHASAAELESEKRPRQLATVSGLCAYTVPPTTGQEPRTTVSTRAQTSPPPQSRSGGLAARAPVDHGRPPRGVTRSCGVAYTPRLCVAYARGECEHGKRCFHMHGESDAELRRATRRRALVAQGLANVTAAPGPAQPSTSAGPARARHRKRRTRDPPASPVNTPMASHSRPVSWRPPNAGSTPRARGSAVRTPRFGPAEWFPPGDPAWALFA